MNRSAHRRHLVAIVSISALLSCVVVWLAWVALERDRELGRSRLRDRLEQGADRVVAKLSRELARLHDTVAELNGLAADEFASRATQSAHEISAGAVVLLFEDELSAYPEKHLVFSTARSSRPDPMDEVFREGRVLEFQRDDYIAAADFFARLAESTDPSLRVGALLRLARTLKKVGDSERAMDAYDRMILNPEVSINGVAAGLVARFERCRLLMDTGHEVLAKEEAGTLYAALLDGEWRLPEAAFEHYRRELVGRFDITPRSGDAAAVAVATGVARLGTQWRIQSEFGSEAMQLVNGSWPGQGRQLAILTQNGTATMFWASTGNNMVGIVTGPAYLKALEQSAATGEDVSVELFVSRASGGAEASSGGTLRAERLSSASGLPWAVAVQFVESGPRESTMNRNLVVGAALITVLAVFASSYSVHRALRRELEVSELKSDFVATVSHEFRTPLTSMSHLIEMLAEHRVDGDERRDHYYLVLQRETRRLQRLVEGLLDFTRMEKEAQRFQFATINVGALAEEIASDFAAEVAELGFVITIELEGPGPELSADAEALRRAVWNLLDNAVKYSPTSREVKVRSSTRGTFWALEVTDQGLGVSREEHDTIFERFTRGSSAAAAPSSKGTGIGLAMVREIAAAHHGSVQIDSHPGRGSTFTLLIPLPPT